MALSGKHAIITGGGSGIGAAIAQRLAADGALVTIIGRRLQPLETVAANSDTINAISADVTDPYALAITFESACTKYGPAAIVVANAGAASSGPFTKLTAQAWQRDLNVNLTGVFNTFQCALKHRPETHGRLIAIASTAGLIGYPYVSAYCAAKHGVVGLVKSLAQELAGTGITVNAVCPGYTDTPMLDAALENIVAKTGMSRSEAESSLLKSMPANRFVSTEEVASAVGWLCQEDTGSVTGQAIAITGGEQ